MNPVVRRILFRLELGGATGWGHLARCAALAEEMQRRGWSCQLWTDGDVLAAPDDLRAPFDDVIPAGPTWSAQAPRGDVIVVDWYGASDAALRELRGSVPGASLLVIDDEGQRTLDAADVILNTRLGLRRSPYAPTVPALLGESFALLRAGLRQPAGVTSPFASGVKPILIMMGGTDPLGLTTEVVHGIADVDTHSFAPVVIAGRPGPSRLSAALARFNAHQWLERIDAATLAGWAGICHAAVSACGGTLYELAALDLRFIGVVVAENQRAFGREVAQRWGMPVIDKSADVRQSVAPALSRLFTHSGGRTGIDGQGAARVADALAAIRG